MRVTCSAPGKLVLLGEYAVLHGHPAVVAAVDRRARVRLAPAPHGRCTVVAPRLAGRVSFDLAPGGAVAWEDAKARLPLVGRLLAAMAEARLLPEALPPFAATLDTTAFFTAGDGPRRKLGLGSSAALSVAFAAALQRWSGAPTARRDASWLETLVRLHREAQNGHGSGVDVAAACLGGVVAYRLGEEGEVRLAERLALPQGMHLLCFWTGRSADTAEFLARIDACVESDGHAVANALEELGAIATRGLEALRGERMDAWLSCVDSCCDALVALGRAASLPIVTEEHALLRRIVAAYGGGYKPSGAGGGDVGVAFLPDPESARAAAAAATRAGFAPLALAISPTGLRLRVVPA